MRNLFQKDKRGISLMIGYVLLIVIGVSLSIGVFVYLKLYLPKDQPACHEDVSLIINEVTCASGQINITVSNRGLFNVGGIQIRIGDSKRLFRQLINEDEGFIFKGDSDGTLSPGESWKNNYTYSELGLKDIEIEPLQYIDNFPVLCEKSIAKQTVSCV